MKICSKCGTKKSLYDFYVVSRKSDKRRAKCKACSSISTQVARVKNQKYYQDNKDKLKESARAYRSSRKNECNEKAKASYASRRVLALKQKQEYYLSNREKILTSTKIYRNSPAGKLVALNSRHKRRAISKTGDIKTSWLKDLKFNSTNCKLCKALLTDDDVSLSTHRHLDHIIPVNIGGGHTMNNVRYVCKKCNLARPKDGRDL
jgi:hypothetical protein